MNLGTLEGGVFFLLCMISQGRLPTGCDVG